MDNGSARPMVKEDTGEKDNAAESSDGSSSGESIYHSATGGDETTSNKDGEDQDDTSDAQSFVTAETHQSVAPRRYQLGRLTPEQKAAEKAKFESIPNRLGRGLPPYSAEVSAYSGNIRSQPVGVDYDRYHNVSQEFFGHMESMSGADTNSAGENDSHGQGDRQGRN
ncbi:hypothetical protein EJ06DRAFT_579791 [Trichodelitschia bisporula]|uniref:Uncharacterized protein n=1 Tax=Trichodelitschia bisporula TaxID=703511 RepID=A0A6G1I746_9PEZI|nr:hypothetical protein EJ06DRAFT_579791 [Trichodelitschia bisporula]